MASSLLRLAFQLLRVLQGGPRDLRRNSERCLQNTQTAPLAAVVAPTLKSGNGNTKTHSRIPLCETRCSPYRLPLGSLDYSALSFPLPRTTLHASVLHLNAKSDRGGYVGVSVPLDFCAYLPYLFSRNIFTVHVACVQAHWETLALMGSRPNRILHLPVPSNLHAWSSRDYGHSLPLSALLVTGRVVHIARPMTEVSLILADVRWRFFTLSCSAYGIRRGARVGVDLHPCSSAISCHVLLCDWPTWSSAADVIGYR
ncbi:hypothetical protein VNO80_01326 [Phaseolus coccineus]|uniref:Uncharacterized protein n=1 Tax=Phaseolus coccineus TaxID=3886 RepID=A0AAN9RSP1_PHACN